MDFRKSEFSCRSIASSEAAKVMQEAGSSGRNKILNLQFKLVTSDMQYQLKVINQNFYQINSMNISPRGLGDFLKTLMPFGFFSVC
jgi:hypothetical protein